NGEVYDWDGRFFEDTLPLLASKLVTKLDVYFYQHLDKLIDAKDFFKGEDALALAAIRQRHADFGGDAGELGSAVTPLQQTADGRAFYMDFQRGAIYWTAERGALALKGGNWGKYVEAGRHTGQLGLPIQEEQSVLNDTYRTGSYEFGTVVWKKATQEL